MSSTSYVSRMLAVVLTGVVATAGCGSERPRGGRSASGDADGVVHVHGLGIDPADGTLYAATHHGLFRIPASGTASRVSDTRQDTMGFTVAGPRHFLGSGHPDPSDTGQPPRLGLIETIDAGRTWRAISLSGDVDFHALEAAGERVYGWDSGSGQLYSSSDGGRTWDRRATMPLYDIAVSPADPDLLLATARSGIVRSTDGGRQFHPLGLDTPTLVVLDWPADADLWGIDPAGVVRHSADGGRTWQTRGRLDGQPEAFTAEGAALYAAIRGTGIWQSHDGGRTWRQRYRDPG